MTISAKSVLLLCTIIFWVCNLIRSLSAFLVNVNFVNCVDICDGKCAARNFTRIPKKWLHFGKVIFSSSGHCCLVLLHVPGMVLGIQLSTTMTTCSRAVMVVIGTVW